MFDPKSFIVSWVVSRSLIHFEFIFVYGVKEYLLLLISSLIPLWSENIFYMISVLNLLRSVLWPGMWSTLVYILCEYLRKMCILSCRVKCYKMIARSFLLMALLNSIPLLIFLSSSINTGRNTEVSKYNCGFVCFFFQFYQFLLHIFFCFLVYEHLG